ncbi:MAG: single-stranded-DNA-specific exonuclease RecJ, partial [Nitrospinaceae bacterium]|nr:single-stranded-DNA-specific exonuclease RecJ [Nitrospinaceae bacterium]NIS85795.1 single-stranded-DNA-specific exonuclease RecJ [Nitrospinaceae bacterium]NIT82645.1 single-stranded-DNA-specific exonuclease RecJ [Nitrospinaceae bacterium]NIU97018.1 single-stranded-DNA-specific exonuclease RecJ [Nitrospinaceae bacterium]NIY15891.1 single-stranded-DNA-specific exonuclease RecJ [Nitrospinaceae bacterium]
GVLHHRKSWSRDRLPNLKQHLDLFVLGTIADVAPLTGENHILSRHGLDVIRTTQKPGLVALKSVAGVEGRLDARSIGFALGPRLNAAGRLGKADSGLHLLTATDLQEALNLAREIDAVNRERKEIQDWTLSEAEDRIEREVDLERDRVIVLASENFHAGVIGIAAARLVEKYFRPTVLIALDGGKGKGSGRSIPRFNLHKAFQDCTDCLEQFGGHAYAAGCTLRESQVEAFRQRMNEVGHRILAEDDLVPELRIDGDMDLGRIDRDLYRHLQLLEPYGAQNPHPVFCARNVRIQGLRFMGKSQNHVRFQAIQDTGRLEAVGFGMAELFESVIPDEDRVDLAFEIQRNTWNGRDKIELRLLDLRKSGEGVSGPA